MSITNTPFYRLKVGSDLLEYKVQNCFIRSVFRLFHINTQVTLPINMITRSKSTKATFGHFIEFTIKEPSNKRDTQFRQKRLRKFWVIRRAPLKKLMPKMMVDSTRTQPTFSQNHTLSLPIVNHNNVA